MKILFATRGEEITHVKPVLDLFAEKGHQVIVAHTDNLTVPYWYSLICLIEEYRFYNRVIPHQALYWKKRIEAFYPDWLRKTIKYFPDLSRAKKFYTPPRKIFEELKQVNPDIVMTTSLSLVPAFVDHAFLAAARKLNIPVIGFVPTWDSLTTKTKISPAPDLMFCWNEFHKLELMKYHDIPEEKIVMAGPYTFEWFLRGQSIESREDFAKKHGFDPKLPIVTYLCSSPSIIADETGIIEDFLKKLPAGYQAIVKPHPYNLLKPIEGARINSTDSYNVYYHSTELYGINTSAMIEAMIVGQKTFKLAVDLPSDAQKCIHFKAIEPYLHGDIAGLRSWLGIIPGRLPSEIVYEKIMILENCERLERINSQ